MTRRSLLTITLAVTVSAVIALVLYFNTSMPSAAAARPAGGGSTSEATFTVTPGSTNDDVPTATPCPTDKFPIFEGTGCGTATATPTSQHPYPCDATPGAPAPTNTPGGPTSTSTPTGTPCPVPVPYGAALRLIDTRPSPAIAGRMKTWVFEMENVGSAYGCEAHWVDFYATMTGVADQKITSSAHLGCHETTQVTFFSRVTASPGQTVMIEAHASAGASPIRGYVSVGDPVVSAGDFNCNGSINSIDAALILQFTAGLIQRLG